MAKKKKSFEESMARLTEIVAAMECDDGVSLSDSVKLYKEGIGLTLLCREELSKAQTTVLELNRKLNGEIAVNPFTKVDYDEE